MNWLSENVGTISVATLGVAIATAVGKGFFGKLGEQIFKRYESRINKPKPVEVDAKFEPHDAGIFNYAWVPENKKVEMEKKGYSYYEHSQHSARCFRTVVHYGSLNRQEYLMRRP